MCTYFSEFCWCNSALNFTKSSDMMVVFHYLSIASLSSGYTMYLTMMILSLSRCRFECGLYKSSGSGKLGIAKRQTLGHMASTFTLKTTVAWFDLLLASLDCYMFVFTQDLLTPTQVFKGMLCLIIRAS